MNEIIKIKDLTFQYADKIIFDKLNLSIKKNSFTTVVGPNSCGKSTLVKILCGLTKFDGYINVDGLSLNSENLDYIRMKLGIIFETNGYAFVAETVIDEIAFILENLCYPKGEIKKEIDRVNKLLNLKSILYKDPNNLNDNDKQLVSLACALVVKPKVLIVDETLNMVNDKKAIFNKLKTLKDTTIINISHDLNDCLYGDEIVVLNAGKVVLQGSNKEVLSKEDILNKIGLKVPFIVDLSLKLQYYDLVDDIILDMDEMVAKLWK